MKDEIEIETNNLFNIKYIHKQPLKMLKFNVSKIARKYR